MFKKSGFNKKQAEGLSTHGPVAIGFPVDLVPVHGSHLGWRYAGIFFELPIKVGAVRITHAERNIRRLLIRMQEELRGFLDAVLVQIIREACADLLLKQLT